MSIYKAFEQGLALYKELVNFKLRGEKNNSGMGAGWRACTYRLGGQGRPP